jgi:holo-[acyl-carrier protein] synthase
MAMIGVGIDLVEIERVELLLRRKGDHAMRRLLTEAERAYVESRGHPERHFAARFAAKEATYKALQSLPGARAIGWRDIEVLSGDMGRPVLALHGVAREVAEAVGGITLHVSLTHTEQTAGAVVVAEGRSEKGEARSRG